MTLFCKNRGTRNITYGKHGKNRLPWINYAQEQNNLAKMLTHSVHADHPYSVNHTVL